MNTVSSADNLPLVPQSPATPERRVYIVDDNSDVRRSLHFSLASVGIQAWPFVCAEDFLDQVSTLSPSPVLLDIRMPGTNGLDMLAALRNLEITWPVIMMSAHGDIPIAVRSIHLGAMDFIEKPFGIVELEEVLASAYAHLAQATQVGEQRRGARALWERLTAREAQVLDLLVAGAANKAVANELGISVRTIEIHRSSALAKLEVKSLAQVVVLRQAATA